MSEPATTPAPGQRTTEQLLEEAIRVSARAGDAVLMAARTIAASPDGPRDLLTELVWTGRHLEELRGAIEAASMVRAITGSVAPDPGRGLRLLPGPA